MLIGILYMSEQNRRRWILCFRLQQTAFELMSVSDLWTLVLKVPICVHSVVLVWCKCILLRFGCELQGSWSLVL